MTVNKIGKNRIEVIDSLRGFAIMGIMLLHSIEHFNFYVFPNPETQPDWLNSIDSKVWDSLFFMFSGKGYAIFAVLFGFTFSLMMRKQRKKKIDFGYRFLWRMVLLAGFAVVNGMFFPGEVLMMYAILGLSLFFVRNLKTQLILIVSALFLMQPIEWFHYIRFAMDNTYVAPALGTGKYWNLLKEGQLSNSIIDLITVNTLYGHKASLLWALSVGRMTQTIGLFALGYWLGIKQLFSDLTANTKFWKRVLIVSIVTFIPLYVLKVYIKDIFELKIYMRTIGVIIKMYGNLAFSLAMIASFYLLYKTKVFRRIAGGLQYCGRMSLTAYMMQSIIGGFVFYGYGLGIGPSVSHTVSLCVGIVLFSFQYYFCKFWIRKFKQGPLEMLWHKLTWIRSN
ncbi:DUF418 domain-containing protein [Saccharicrinis fermentans]|uniref:DUF418 domain-containing protein n=2 Tax=Saccharicrinis fermentans TaxID=982 RepID=UPI0004864897|nr:DUF418 domain-containing protein [Saccharicrinis fermentans]